MGTRHWRHPQENATELPILGQRFPYLVAAVSSKPVLFESISRRWGFGDPFALDFFHSPKQRAFFAQLGQRKRSTTMAAPTIGHLLGSPSNKDREQLEDLLRQAASSLRGLEKQTVAPRQKKVFRLTYAVAKLLRTWATG